MEGVGPLADAQVIAERIAAVTEARAWPWMRPGAVSVGMDDDGSLVEYVATETELVPRRFLA